MKSLDFNNELRKIFNSFISDGFIKSDISAVTFGLNRQDQLVQFLSGRDMGIKPLNKIFDNLGFEFHIVPILTTDTDNQEIVNNIAQDSLDGLNMILFDYLQNKKQNKNKKSGIAIFVDELINNLNKE